MENNEQSKSNLKPFQAGYDPRRNTKGRPKGSPNMRTAFMRALKKKVKVGDKDMWVDDVIVTQLMNKAMRGNLQAMKIILDRVDGKVMDPEHEEREKNRRGVVIDREEDWEEFLKMWPSIHDLPDPKPRPDSESSVS